MTQVRTVEKNQKLGCHQKESLKVVKELTTKIQEALDDGHKITGDSQQVTELQESLTVEEEYEPEPLIEESCDDYEGQEHIEEPQEVELPYPKRFKTISTSFGAPKSITFTHYELEQYKENDQNIITLNVIPLMLVSDTGYQFDVSWISHSDPSSIYKCKYCIKAFSNAEFLLKHTISSHLCLICCAACENYKELSNHSKKHKTVTCHFCNKLCSSPSNFRQHLKKIHCLSNVPAHIGILK